MKQIPIEQFEVYCKEVVLERIKIRSQGNIDTELYRSIGARSYLQPFAMSLAMTLEAHVFAEKPKRVQVSYPANWVEALKDRWLPQWLKTKYPVKLERQTMEARFLYPLLPQTKPEYTAFLALKLFQEKDLAA